MEKGNAATIAGNGGSRGKMLIASTVLQLISYVQLNQDVSNMEAAHFC